MASKCPYEKVIFIFKKSIKEMETLLHKKSDNVKFLTSYSLDIRAWSTETLTNISLLLYGGVINPFCDIGLFVHLLKISEALIFWRSQGV